MIKPNNHELEEIFNVKLDTVEDIIFYAKKLQDMGARNVLISRGKDGALLITENSEVLISNVAKGNVINSVGAGDSMVAGFVYGYLTEKSYKKAFYYGVCTGSASAFSENLATREEVDVLLKRYISEVDS